jgi:hypothetical protein
MQRLGTNGPTLLSILGARAPLSSSMLAFLCSKDTPGSSILKAFDHAAAWRDAGSCVISGFHSPLERQCLDILLRGQQPIVMVRARTPAATRPTASTRSRVPHCALPLRRR